MLFLFGTVQLLVFIFQIHYAQCLKGPKTTSVSLIPEKFLEVNYYLPGGNHHVQTRSERVSSSDVPHENWESSLSSLSQKQDISCRCELHYLSTIIYYCGFSFRTSPVPTLNGSGFPLDLDQINAINVRRMTESMMFR